MASSRANTLARAFLKQDKGIDFDNKVIIDIPKRRSDAQLPQMMFALRCRGRVHPIEAQ